MNIFYPNFSLNTIDLCFAEPKNVVIIFQDLLYPKMNEKSYRTGAKLLEVHDDKCPHACKNLSYL